MQPSELLEGLAGLTGRHGQLQHPLAGRLQGGGQVGAVEGPHVGVADECHGVLPNPQRHAAQEPGAHVNAVGVSHLHPDLVRPGPRPLDAVDLVLLVPGLHASCCSFQRTSSTTISSTTSAELRPSLETLMEATSSYAACLSAMSWRMRSCGSPCSIRGRRWRRVRRNTVSGLAESTTTGPRERSSWRFSGRMTVPPPVLITTSSNLMQRRTTSVS